MIVKPELADEAKKMFENTNVQISTNGQRHLGAAIGTQEFIEAYAAQKIEKWVKEIARTHSHAAYAAFVHGAIGRWLYLMRTINISSSIFQPLEQVIHHQFIPALTGQASSSPEVRKLMSLPTRHGGLNIVNPVELAERQLSASKAVIAPLKKMIIERSEQFTKPQLQSVKSTIHREKCQFHAAKPEQVKGEIPATL